MVIWFWYSLVAAVMGGAGCAWVLSGVHAPSVRTWRRRLSTVNLISASLLLIAVGARLWSQTTQAFGGDQPMSTLLLRVIVTETPWGRGWTWQALGSVLCLTGAVLVRRNNAQWPLLLTAAVFTAFATSFTGHAVGMNEGVWITVFAQGTHVIAAGLWLGTLAALLIVTFDDVDADGVTGTFRLALQRFSTVAQPAVALLVLAGAVATWRHVGSLANMATPYGFVLALKVAAFAGAAACGFHNWRRLTPQLGLRRSALPRMWRLAGLEVSLGIVALALTAIIGTLPMPGHDH